MLISLEETYKIITEDNVDILINELRCYDIDTDELQECKNNVIKHKCYGSRDVWFIETMEDTSQKYIHNDNDFLF